VERSQPLLTAAATCGEVGSSLAPAWAQSLLDSQVVLRLIQRVAAGAGYYFNDAFIDATKHELVESLHIYRTSTLHEEAAEVRFAAALIRAVTPFHVLMRSLMEDCAASAHESFRMLMQNLQSFMQLVPSRLLFMIEEEIKELSTALLAQSDTNHVLMFTYAFQARLLAALLKVLIAAAACLLEIVDLVDPEGTFRQFALAQLKDDGIWLAQERQFSVTLRLSLENTTLVR
jgi:hypothetical protein